MQSEKLIKIQFSYAFIIPNRRKNILLPKIIFFIKILSIYYDLIMYFNDISAVVLYFLSTYNYLYQL